MAPDSHPALYSKRELEISNQLRLADRPDGLACVGNGLRDAVRIRRRRDGVNRGLFNVSA